MSYQVVAFTKSGVLVADGAIAAANMVTAAISGEAVVFVVKTADNAAPALDVIKNLGDLQQVTSNVVAGDMNANVKESFANALGMMAAIASIGAGPAAALAADQLMSSKFKDAYDAASNWSSQHDWSPLFDLIDKIRADDEVPISPRAFDLDLYLVPGLPSVIDPICISPTIGTTPDPKVKVKVVRYVDPLILDLDGDGLEISPLSKGVLFDANGDTIKTGTAWAASDDGMLVWDRNGNGLIDSGGELFGDETVLVNGQKAANGFVALAELDSNADGKFDLSDAQYASLRIWRDMNQDGISQADELQTLADSGVKSIGLANTTVNTNYTDAILAQSGSFTRMDDSTGQAGSFILAQNNFVRAFAPITVSADAKALNNVGGSGWVRDLQEAATQSPELIGLYNQIKNATTRDGYKQAVGALMQAWGNDSGYSGASKQAQADGYGLILSDPLDEQERGWMDAAVKGSADSRNAFRATLSAADVTKFDAMRERMVGGLENIHACAYYTQRSRKLRRTLRPHQINTCERTMRFVQVRR